MGLKIFKSCLKSKIVLETCLWKYRIQCQKSTLFDQISTRGSGCKFKTTDGLSDTFFKNLKFSSLKQHTGLILADKSIFFNIKNQINQFWHVFF